uniref:hypothetical protein n=1 Tax=Thalassotalea litorea TaxID=2020715 RepID=UPI0037360FB1
MTVGFGFVNDKDRLLEFFCSFSRLEYALKESGFFRGNDRRVEVNWDDFAKSIDIKFSEIHDKELKTSIEYFQQHPPLKQVLSHGCIEWHHDKSVVVKLNWPQFYSFARIFLLTRLATN